jgi:hypothetical protein
VRGTGIARALGAAAIVGGVGLAGCGGAAQDANEPSGTYTVRIEKASFPAKQQLAQQSLLAIQVTNAGSKDVPNVGVTIGRPEGGSDFTLVSDQPYLANASRPIWIVDTDPANGVTAYRNTWALGKLRPQETKTFTWRLTAVRSGTHKIDYRISAGLNGKAKAQLPGGGDPTGSITVRIRQKASKSCVDEAGGVVRNPVPQGRRNACVGSTAAPPPASTPEPKASRQLP